MEWYQNVQIDKFNWKHSTAQEVAVIRFAWEIRGELDQVDQK